MTRDMDTVKMSYEEMIDTLKGLVFGTFDRTTAKEREALDMAIKALQTEPSVSVILIPEGVTNGDVFLKTHPEVVATIIKKEGYLFNCVQLRNKGETIPFAEVYIDWWNAPYKVNLSESEDNIWHDVFISL